MSPALARVWPPGRLRDRVRTLAAGRGRTGTVEPGPAPAELPSDLGSHDRSAAMFDGGGPADGPRGEARRQGRRGGPRRGGRRERGDDGGRETPMVPKASFTSYYGRPVLKPPVWKDDIAYYFFLGGLAAGCSVLAAGADRTGRPALRRGTRVTSLGALGLGTYYLIHDLGRPERFHHMLRVAKPTSPMSMGTWALAGYGAPMGLAAVSEVMPARLRSTLPGRLVGATAGPAGLVAAVIAPAVASYTAVLLSQTSVPAWHASHPELPFVFTGSAAGAAGGLGMIVAPLHEASPARRFAAFGALVELAASHRLESRVGLVAETFHDGEAGRELQLARVLTAAGALGGLLLGGRSRVAAVASGLALLAGSFYERIGVLHAGVASTKDPKYVVSPQRERIAARARQDGTPLGAQEDRSPPPAPSND